MISPGFGVKQIFLKTTSGLVVAVSAAETVQLKLAHFRDMASLLMFDLIKPKGARKRVGLTPVYRSTISAV